MPNTNNLLADDQSVFVIEEDKPGCGDCYKLSIEMAEVKLELAMLSALVGRFEVNRNDLGKNLTSMSPTVNMKCVSTQTIQHSDDMVPELSQSKKSISSAPFYHQLNSYRSASKIKFDKLNRVNKPSCVKDLKLPRLRMHIMITRLKASDKDLRKAKRKLNPYGLSLD